MLNHIVPDAESPQWLAVVMAQCVLERHQVLSLGLNRLCSNHIRSTYSIFEDKVPHVTKPSPWS